jgi:Choline/Carnitine o-acyltransferase
MDLFPTPDAVFGKFAESAIADPRKRRRFLSLLNFFGITRYAEKKRQTMIALAERGINPFDIDTVPSNFSGIYAEFGVSILFEKMNDSVAQRATKLIIAALAYRRSLLDGLLETESSGGTAIGTDRNHNLFGRVANVRKTGLKWHKDIKHCRDSTHIVVAVDGFFYKLDVIDDSGTRPAEDILHEIESVMRAATEDNSLPKPYGLITTNMAKSTAGIFYADNPDESVRTIDEAIFLLAIDTRGYPVDENAAAQDINIRNNHNRDYRKSLQLVVLQNGYAGATCNYFAGVEGVLAATFASWLNSYAKAIPPIVAAKRQTSFSKLNFDKIDFGTLPLARLKAKVASYSCDFPLIRTIDAIGKDGIKRLNVSPDAFFHAAAHLAYYERFKKIPSMHNLADIRGIKFGSITRYLTTTGEMAEFLQRQTKPALLNACRAHKEKIGAIKSGDNPIHYAFYYLGTDIGFKPLLALGLFRIFVPDLFTRHISPDIWASNIPALPGIYCQGRFGMLFKFARNNCLAGHYLLFPDHIKICFLANKKSFLESWSFDQALGAAMIKLETILLEPADEGARDRQRVVTGTRLRSPA